jgi:hypothetical protein
MMRLVSNRWTATNFDGGTIMTNGSTPAGWYQDPTGQGDARYWNGTAWTQSVDRSGTTVNVPIDSTLAQQPPVPGTQVQIPTPAAAPAPQTVVQQSSSSSPLGTIIGVVVVVLLFVVVLAFIGNNNSSSDTPTPGSDAPPAEAPATDTPPATGG